MMRLYTFIIEEEIQYTIFLIDKNKFNRVS